MKNSEVLIQVNIQFSRNDNAQNDALLSDRVQAVFAENLSQHHRKLLVYVWCYPGAYTHEIVRDCGVGNIPSRAGELNDRILYEYGLFLDGSLQPGLQNWFEEPSDERRWNIVLAE
jgi:hypothetical protein